MRVTVRLFALQRARAGSRSHELELPDGSDVAAAWEALVAELPALAASPEHLRFARNGTYVGLHERLREGDELAVIPPVAGGGPDDAAADVRYRRLELREDSIDGGLLDELRSAVATPADGAVAIFVGQTRESPGTPAPGQEAEAARFAGQRVTGLTYEAYEPMALSTLEAIADEIEARFDVRRLAVVHRTGDVEAGASSVIIVVAAAHRGEAFEACRYAIEELKARVPIWKAERFGDGRVWMGSPARQAPPEPSEDPAGRGGRRPRG